MAAARTMLMGMKATGEAALHEIDRFDRGVGWIAYPEETMERASHALAVPNDETAEDDVWVIDPVDAPGLDDLLAEFGSVAGVVVCLDRHKRDSAAVATRHDVPVYVPEWMTGVADEIDAPVRRFSSRLADSGFETIRIRNSSLPRGRRSVCSTARPSSSPSPSARRRTSVATASVSGSTRCSD